MFKPPGFRSCFNYIKNNLKKTLASFNSHDYSYYISSNNAADKKQRPPHERTEIKMSLQSARKETKELMQAYSQTLPPSAARAQCINIASYTYRHDQTIADRLECDHRSADGALRAATLMVEAGAAIEEKTERQIKQHLYGTFVFLDGSKL